MHLLTTSALAPRPLSLQVFEYCSTDLKKYMDRLGKGPSFPLSLVVIKVGGLMDV